MTVTVPKSSRSNTVSARKKFRHRTLLASASLLVLGTVSPVLGQTWDGSESVDWFDGGNWVGGTVPIQDEDVLIDTITPNPTVVGDQIAVGSGRGESRFLTIGGSNDGSLTIENGGLVRSIYGYIGQNAGSVGSVLITGTNNASLPYASEWRFRTNTLYSQSVLHVGQFGEGNLTLSNGGIITNVDSSFIGTESTGVGTALVTGTGSSWTTNNRLMVGYQGEGYLSVLDGGTVISSIGRIGSIAGSTGNAVVSGDTSNWTLSSSLAVGHAGTGELRIADGGLVTGGAGLIGRDATGDGTAVVTGDGSRWVNSINFIVGYYGTGDLSVLDGASVTSLRGSVGELSGSVGTVLVSGADSNWSNTEYFFVGNSGIGTLSITDGGMVSGTAVALGYNISGIGTINIGAASGAAAASTGELDVPTILFGDGTGTVVFNHTDLTETFDAAFTFESRGGGAHTILHEAGWTNFSGDSSLFDGTTEIEGGTLSVDGTLGGLVNLNDGGRLEGTGMLTGLLNVNDGGTFAPGNSIGTKNVADVVFNAGSIYEVEIDDQGNSDLINASGIATLNGGTVSPLGTSSQGLSYTILTAAGGVTGNFDDVTRSLLFQYALSYDANNVYLTSDALHDNFCSVASTSNENAVACNGLDSLLGTNDVVSAVLALTSEEAGREAFNMLSGEIHPSTTGALMDNGQSRIATVLERVQRAQNSSGSAVSPLGYVPSGATYGSGHSETSTASFGDLSSVADEGSGFWATGYGSWSNTDATTNTAQMDNDLRGVIFGLDRDTSENWRFGLSGGYSRTDTSQDDRSSSSIVDSYSLGTYGGYENGLANLSFGGFYNWHDIDSNRTAAFTGLGQTLTAKYNAQSWQAFAETSYELQVGGVMLEPLVSASYIGINTDGFSESGGTAALTASSSVQHTVFSTAGFRASMDLGRVKARAMLGWRHAFGDRVPASTFTLAGSSAFAVEGVPLVEDSVVTKVGFEAALTESISLGAAYTGQFGTGSTAHGAKGMMRIRF